MTEKNQVLTVMEGLLEGLKKSEGVSTLSADYKAELEAKKIKLDADITKLQEKLLAKKTELKTVENELNIDEKNKHKAMKQMATIAGTLGIDLSALGITLPEVTKNTSSGGKKGIDRQSKFYVDGKEFLPPSPEKNTISYVLWTSTKGFGGANGNGSLSKAAFEQYASKQGIDVLNGDDYSITIASVDDSKTVTIERKLQDVTA